MPITMAAVGGGASILGGLIGNAASQGDIDKATARRAQALAGLQGLTPPTAEQLQVALEKYKLTGEVTPELQSVISQGQSEMSGISTDPTLRQAQMGALAKLQQMGSGGLQPQDLAALNQVQQESAGMGQAQQASALQAMQQRGIGGGGAELAARLSAAQGAANRSQQGGMDIHSQAAQRALQAIAQAGQLGGQIRGQEFGEAAQKAQAQDIINRFNAANAQSVQGQNVGAKNQAQYYNVGQQQQIANMNTQTAQQQAMQHAQALQQAYNNQAQKAQAVYGGEQTAANQDMDAAKRTQQLWSGIGQGVGSTAMAMGSMPNGKTKAPSPAITNYAGPDENSDPSQMFS